MIHPTVDIHTYLKPGVRVHLAGIGGVSMCPLAEVLRGMGLTVQGSDMSDGPSVQRLKSLGIPVSQGHSAENLGDCDFVIRTAAVHDGNPEIAGAVARGTAVGGWKIVKTMGHRIFKLEPVHGFAAESSAALVITGASLLGAPVSTTHTISACIFGVGSTKRLSAVRWNVAGSLLVAWTLTLPAAGIVGFISYKLLHFIWN